MDVFTLACHDECFLYVEFFGCAVKKLNYEKAKQDYSRFVSAITTIEGKTNSQVASIISKLVLVESNVLIELHRFENACSACPKNCYPIMKCRKDILAERSLSIMNLLKDYKEEVSKELVESLRAAYNLN